jgi:hypothetical protein
VRWIDQWTPVQRVHHVRLQEAAEDPRNGDGDDEPHEEHGDEDHQGAEEHGLDECRASRVVRVEARRQQHVQQQVTNRQDDEEASGELEQAVDDPSGGPAVHVGNPPILRRGRHGGGAVPDLSRRHRLARLQRRGVPELAVVPHRRADVQGGRLRHEDVAAERDGPELEDAGPSAVAEGTPRSSESGCRRPR